MWKSSSDCIVVWSFRACSIISMQFLDKLYDLMVTSNEDLTLSVMLNAFNGIARLVTKTLIRCHIIIILIPIVLTKTTDGWNGLSKNFPVFLMRLILSNSRKHCISRR